MPKEKSSEIVETSETSELETFLDELPKEGDEYKPSETEGEKKDTSPASSPDDKTKTDKPTDGGDNTQPDKLPPFHEHPRWIQREKDWEAKLDELKTDYETKLSALEERLDKPDGSTPPIAKWFLESFGENQEAWREYLSYESEQRSAIKQEVITEITDQVQKQRQEQANETAKWDKWVVDSITTLEAEGLKFDRNELMKITLEYLPTDAEGNIDFRKGYDLLSKLTVKDDGKTQEKKKVAGSTMTDSKPETKRTTIGHEELKNKDFLDLVRE